LNVKMKEQVWVDGSAGRVRWQQFEGENDNRIRVIAILFCWEVWYKYFRLGMMVVGGGGGRGCLTVNVLF
jgi:hypothetical protein